MRQKYLSPPGRSNMLYVVPGIDRGFLLNTSVPVVVTEGGFKTLALWRLAITDRLFPVLIPVSGRCFQRVPCVLCSRRWLY